MQTKVVGIDSNAMIDIFRIDLRFFDHEKVYEIQDSKFHGFAPKRLHFDASHGRLHFDASPESDVFIEFKRDNSILLCGGFPNLMKTVTPWTQNHVPLNPPFFVNSL